MQNDLPSLIIADSSCLIALAKIDLLELLYAMYGSITITPEIAAECDIELPGWIHIELVKNAALHAAIRLELHSGEASAIALALENPGSLVVLDDRKARRYAAKLGLNITGILGIVKAAGEQGRITDTENVFEKLRKTGFRMPKE